FPLRQRAARALGSFPAERTLRQGCRPIPNLGGRFSLPRLSSRPRRAARRLQAPPERTVHHSGLQLAEMTALLLRDGPSSVESSRSGTLLHRNSERPRLPLKNALGLRLDHSSPGFAARAGTLPELCPEC